jgi:hypothetical protein
MKTQDQKLSTLEKVGFGAGDMALNVVISSMMLIITFFYTDIYGLKTTDLALLFVLVKVVGALSDLVVGQMTDTFLTRGPTCCCSPCPTAPASSWCSRPRTGAMTPSWSGPIPPTS